MSDYVNHVSIDDGDYSLSSGYGGYIYVGDNENGAYVMTTWRHGGRMSSMR